MRTLKESILSSTKTGKSAFLIPETKDELNQLILTETREKGFNCDLNHIKTHKITDMAYLFYCSNFDGDISKWDISNVTNMQSMFAHSKFNQDISNWEINSDCSTYRMFKNCKIRDKYKPKQNGEIIQ